MLPLLRHAAIATVGLLAPGRSRVCALHLIRQIALARVQQRIIAMAGTDPFTDPRNPSAPISSERRRR
jgi:hypothetical protein